jgi:hypothetical protein
MSKFYYALYTPDFSSSTLYMMKVKEYVPYAQGIFPHDQGHSSDIMTSLPVKKKQHALEDCADVLGNVN